MSKRDVVNFPPAFVDPKVADPAALRYAQQLQQRKYNQQVSGGPTPPIPRLDRQHQDGMTMADQAGKASQPSTQSPLFMAPEQQPMPGPMMHRTQTTAPPGAPPTILPNDILPEAAKQDPEYRPGMGSMHASSQPHLAQKYGVIRNGQHLPPQQLASGRPGLSKETIAGLTAMNEYQARATAGVQQQMDKKETEVSGAAGAAARLGSTDESPQPLTDDQRKKMERAIDRMDDFDFNTFREMMMKDILNNEDQRKAVESRLEPLDITDLIVNGRVLQRVPVVPGKFEPTFQSVTGEEDLALKRIVWQEQKSLNAPNQYMLDKYSLMGVALATYAINNTTLPGHQDKNGNFDEEAFMIKFTKVIQLPFHLLSSLGINFFWFDVRVRTLFQADTLKNG